MKEKKQDKDNLYSVVAESFAAPALPIIKELTNQDWVYYGIDNLYPAELIELYNSSAMHRTCIEAIKDGIFGKGIENIGEDYINTQGETIDDIFEKITLDYTLYQGYSLNVIWSKDRSKISEIYHLPFNNVRSGKKDEDDEVVEFFYTDNKHIDHLVLQIMQVKMLVKYITFTTIHPVTTIILYHLTQLQLTRLY